MKKQKTALHSPGSAPMALELYLETESERLERVIERQQELIKLPGTTRGELIEEASEATEQANNIAVLEQLNRELRQMQNARKRLADGLYGICENCGRPIPAARMAALPDATLCVRCQTLRGSEEEQDTRRIGAHRVL